MLAVSLACLIVRFHRHQLSCSDHPLEHSSQSSLNPTMRVALRLSVKRRCTGQHSMTCFSSIAAMVLSHQSPTVCASTVDCNMLSAQQKPASSQWCCSKLLSAQFLKPTCLLLPHANPIAQTTRCLRRTASCRQHVAQLDCRENKSAAASDCSMGCRCAPR